MKSSYLLAAALSLAAAFQHAPARAHGNYHGCTGVGCYISDPDAP